MKRISPERKKNVLAKLPPPYNITHAVVPYLRAAGIGKDSCQLFRHAMATKMLGNGADLRWIQAMLGHRSVGSASGGAAGAG